LREVKLSFYYLAMFTVHTYIYIHAYVHSKSMNMSNSTGLVVPILYNSTKRSVHSYIPTYMSRHVHIKSKNM
jgi:hypothetical protein